jgi:hypothetical protein
MIVALKSPKTGRFLKEFGGETTEITAALHFATGIEAEEYCRDHELEDSEIVYQFEDSRLDFSVKLGGLDVT